jgi:uncharacterized protein involved in exopolysaccharide biosynthesis
MAGFASQTNLPGPLRQGGLAPRQVALVLFRRRWIILAISVPIILVAGGALLGRTGTYTAASRVLVEFLKVDQPRWDVSARTVDFDRELSTLLNIAMSVSVADRAADALADSLPVIRQIDKKLAGLAAGPDFRDYLLEGLEVNVVGESNILEFRHTAENPRVAVMATGALRNAFMKFENTGRRNPGAIQYYAEQIENVRGDIDSLLSVRGDILGATGFTSLEDEMRYSTGAVADVESQLREVRVQQGQLESDYKLLTSYLDRDPREFPAGQDESRASTLVGWRSLVGTHEDALNSILAIHTEDSLPARRQRALLDASLKRLREEELAYTESVRLALESTRARAQTLEGQVNSLKEANLTIPKVYQRVSLLDSEIKSLRDLLEDLQGKWGEVRMAELADGRVSKVIALTEPELVTVLAGSKTMVYLIMIIMLAIALGVVGAFVQESLDHRIYVPDDVEDNLQLPVFASVTRAD